MKNKPRDWDTVVFSAEQVAAGRPKELVATFDDLHVDTAGQFHDIALFKSVEKDEPQTYYKTPGHIEHFIKFNWRACERPDQDSVEIVSGSSARNYDSFWK